MHLKGSLKNSCWHITFVIIINISYNIDFFPHGLVKSINLYWYSGQAVIQVFDFLACSFFFHCFELLFCFTTVCLSFPSNYCLSLLLERNKMI